MLLYETSDIIRTLLTCAVFLMLWFTLMLLAETIYQRMYRGFSVVFMVVVFINYYFFQLCLNEKYRMPLWAVIVFIVIMLVFNLIIIRKGSRYRRENFTVISVKQGMDAMTQGICFYTTNGLPQFVNKPMNEVSQRLTGDSIKDAVRFWERLKSGKIETSCKVLAVNGGMIVVDTGEKVYYFSNRAMEAGDELMEMVMVDITDEYGTYMEMEAKKEALEKQQERLKEYSRSVTKVTIERELLNAKVNIHDELGEILLAAKRYITAGDGDRKTLTELWLRNLKLLGAEKQAAEQDEYEEIYKAARDIGMKIELEGVLPEEKRAKTVIASALHECLTNTFRHAGGDTVYVKVNSDTGDEIVFTNNGNPPVEPVKERGGLKHLREITEDAGFEMRIEPEGRFELIIDITPHQSPRDSFPSRESHK